MPTASNKFGSVRKESQEKSARSQIGKKISRTHTVTVLVARMRLGPRNCIDVFNALLSLASPFQCAGQSIDRLHRRATVAPNWIHKYGVTVGGDLRRKCEVVTHLSLQGLTPPGWNPCRVLLVALPGNDVAPACVKIKLSGIFPDALIFQTLSK